MKKETIDEHEEEIFNNISEFDLAVFYNHYERDRMRRNSGGIQVLTPSKGGNEMRNDSNWTGRMARTSKEAFGHDADFGDTRHLGDKLVGWLTLFLAGFMCGMLFGGWM